DPLATLRRLHAEAVGPGSPDVLWALTELAYLAAERPKAAPEERRSLYLSAATYAYLYLLAAPGTMEASHGRLRIAGEIYDRALARAFPLRGGRGARLVGALRG